MHPDHPHRLRLVRGDAAAHAAPKPSATTALGFAMTSLAHQRAVLDVFRNTPHLRRYRCLGACADHRTLITVFGPRGAADIVSIRRQVLGIDPDAQETFRTSGPRPRSSTPA